MSDTEGGEGTLYSEVQCIMAMVTWGPPLPRDQTDTTENITFPQPSLASSNKDWLKFKYGITRQFSILICKSVTRLIVIT